MKRFLKVIIGVGIIAVAFAIAGLLWITRPVAEKKEEQAELPVAEYMVVDLETLTFDLPSQGIVEADRQTLIAAPVAGRVESVSEKFEAGGEFAKDELMVQLDATDYEAAVAQAAANLADAQTALANEQAKADQAERDWRKLGRGGAPSDLALRKPQLESAKKKIKSAEAALKKAENDLKNTAIKAPFQSVVTSTNTEIGSYLTPGAPVAELYQSSPFEVRLPVSVDEASLLPTDEKGEPKGTVSLSAQAGGDTRKWNAEIIRNEGQIDRETRSLYLVAKVGDPTNKSGINLRPGLFVEASIPSREFHDVAAVPSQAFRNLEEVVVIEEETNKIRYRKVGILHRSKDHVYVSSGLEEGDRVCLTNASALIKNQPVEPQLRQVAPEEEEDPTILQSQN